MRVCELLISRLNKDSAYTDDEYRLITNCVREFENEIFIYRVQQLTSQPRDSADNDQTDKEEGGLR